jgi:hypothetical protein
MRTPFITLAAVALLAATALTPAHADQDTPAWCGHPGQQECPAYVYDGDGGGGTIEAPTEEPIRPMDGSRVRVGSWSGLTDGEMKCLQSVTLKDMLSHLPNTPQNIVHDPIHVCNVPRERWGKAMNEIMFVYRPGSNIEHSTWIDEHCHAKPAIPRNKWVCVEDDLTWEWD